MTRQNSADHLILPVSYTHLMTIHNLKFQGVWDIETMRGLTGFSSDLFVPDKLEYQKDANMLKGGLVYADYITTVSDSYANEIQTGEYGEGLDGLLAACLLYTSRCV